MQANTRERTSKINTHTHEHEPTLAHSLSPPALRARPLPLTLPGFSVVNARRNKSGPISVVLKVISAEGLRRGDLGGIGKSDPYCRVIVEQDGGETAPVQETSIRWATLSPVWDEEFDIKDLCPGAIVRLEVWDKGNTHFKMYYVCVCVCMCM
jgi:hypothetical protein